MSDSGENIGSAFAFLADVSPEKIAHCLSGESPMVIGLALSHLSPPHATKVLANMNSAQQKDVVGAMRKARSAPKDIILRVAETVKSRIETGPTFIGGTHKAGISTADPVAWKPRRVEEANPVNTPPKPDEPLQGRGAGAPGTGKSSIRQTLERMREKKKNLQGGGGSIAPGSTSASPRRSPATGGKAHPVDGMAIAAEILRNCPTELRKNLLQDDPSLYKELRRRMFTFDDFIGTADDSLSVVFSSVEPKVAAIALRFASSELLKRVVTVLSRGRALLIRDEIHAAEEKRVSIREIELAQDKILQVALDLQRKGQILIDPNDPEVL